ncbi:MAG: PstS family phosphate ABC transporter substrate-binding protein [Cytophagaceae bacterium]
MKLFRMTLLSLTLIFFSGCRDEKQKGKDVFEGTITISGAFALYPLVVKWGKEFEKIHPRVRVDISAGGAGKGMADALSDNVNLGMVSRDLKAEEISKGAWGITVARDAVVPTFNTSNPNGRDILSKGLNKEKFLRIWLGSSFKTWGDVLNNGSEDHLNVYTRSDASGAGETWAKFLGKAQEDLKGTGVFGDPGLAEAVRKDKFSIGFNNIAYVYDLRTQKPYEGLGIIPIDFNNNGTIDEEENFYGDHQKFIDAMAQGRYPSPPARELYFVSNGPPKDRLVIEFFKWILTDGQKFVPEAGYLRLSPGLVKAESEILESYY